MGFKNKILFVSLIICILFSVSCVMAVDVNGTDVASDVNEPEVSADVSESEVSIDNNDEVISNASNVAGDKDDGTYTSLQLKIINAADGATITLNNDYKYNDDFKITTGIFINKCITIDGNGHTIDGNNKARIFNINYGSSLKAHEVTLKNIKFKNGFANIYGGAILNFAKLTVEDCTFTCNNAGTAGGAINSLGSLTLKNSQFNKNSAGGDAGAVFSLTAIKGYEFYKKYFENLNATDDSNLLLAIAMALLEPGKDYISNCKFTNNVANGRGGGAVYAYSHIDIKSCTFNSNKAGEKGAAVFACKDLYIKNSKFNKNEVGMYGGAVYFKCHEQSGSYDKNGKWVSSIVYYSNSIKSSTFTKNSAGERGGAIYGFRTSDSDKVHCAKAIKCTFSDNKAPKGRDVYGGTTSKCTFNYLKLTLKSVTVKKSAKKLVLKATLKKGKNAIKGKKITFKFNGKTYKAKTNKKGIAKVTIKKSVLKKLKVGKKVKYQAKYKKLVVKKTAKVKK